MNSLKFNYTNKVLFAMMFGVANKIFPYAPARYDLPFEQKNRVKGFPWQLESYVGKEP